MTQVVHAADGRRLGVECWGAPEGTPVFLLHGTPGSRNGPRPRGIVLYRLGVRLICYDRPGYGLSERHRGRTVAAAAADVAAIADALGIERFSVVGRSGGGPHALACAALLAERVEQAAVLVGLAPVDAHDLDWFDGMADSNLGEYGAADTGHGVTVAKLNEKASHVRADPENLIRSLTPELAVSDRRVMDDIAIRRLLVDTYHEALRCGASGWIDDVLAFRRPWGFELSAVKASTLLWHGADDMFSPVSHARWLAGKITNSRLTVQFGAAHFAAVEVLPAVLAWLATPVAR